MIAIHVNFEIISIIHIQSIRCTVPLIINNQFLVIMKTLRDILRNWWAKVGITYMTQYGKNKSA